jgi:type I restriction enzyme S subunit
LIELLPEAPDAIARLRRFVLDLAVRGKLVEQDPRDEPASRLVDEITQKKSAAIKEAGVSNIPLGKDTDDQTLFDLPTTWQWVSAVFPAVGLSDNGKKVKTRDLLSEGQFPVLSDKCEPVSEWPVTVRVMPSRVDATR